MLFSVLDTGYVDDAKFYASIDKDLVRLGTAIYDSPYIRTVRAIFS